MGTLFWEYPPTLLNTLNKGLYPMVESNSRSGQLADLLGKKMEENNYQQNDFFSTKTKRKLDFYLSLYSPSLGHLSFFSSFFKGSIMWTREHNMDFSWLELPTTCNLHLPIFHLVNNMKLPILFIGFSSPKGVSQWLVGKEVSGAGGSGLWSIPY